MRNRKMAIGNASQDHASHAEPNANDADFVRPHSVMLEQMVHHANHFLDWPICTQIIASIMAGSLITFGAALSIFFSVGDTLNPGPQKILSSVGFIIGFSAVIFSGAALFTEVNVVMPLFTLISLKHYHKGLIETLKCLRFWIVVFFGNVAGSFLLASMMRGANVFGSAEFARLQKVIDKKNAHIANEGGGWWEALLSGVMGNWLVGLAAVFSTRAKTLPGKFVGIVIPVMAFVSLGVQHSPANMGYMGLGLVAPEVHVTFVDAYFWNIVPAALGNLFGALTFVALPFYLLYGNFATLDMSADEVAPIPPTPFEQEQAALA